MAWTDLLQGSQQNVTNLLCQKQQRREGSLSRLQDVLARLSQQNFEAGEAATQRGWQGEQNEAANAATIANTEAIGAQNRLTQDLIGSIGSRQIGEQATAEKELITAREEAQQRLQDNAENFQKTLAGMNNKADMDRLLEQIKAETDAANTAWEQPRTEYEDIEAVINGRKYTWDSDQKYRLVELEVQRDMIMDQISLEARLRDSGSTADSARVKEIFDIEFGLIRQGTGKWGTNEPWMKSFDQKTFDELQSLFVTSLAAYPELDDGAKETLIGLFGKWVTVGPGGGDQATDTADWLSKYMPTPGRSNRQAASSQGFLLPEGAENVVYPLGVDAAERELYKKLASIITTQTQNNQPYGDVQPHMERIVNEKVDPNDPDILRYIESMLQRVLNQGL